MGLRFEPGGRIGRTLAGSTYRALTDRRSGSDWMQSTGSAYTASAWLPV